MRPTMRELWRALRLLVARRAVERDLDDEIRHHLEMQTAQNVARGMRPAAARALAEREFGGVERFKDELRAVHGAPLRARLLDALGTEGRLALRGLRRSPGFVAATALTFGLGIGANATMFGIVDRLVLSPPPHVRDPARVVALAATWTSKGGFVEQPIFAYPTYRAFRDRLPGAASVAVMGEGGGRISLGRGEGARTVSKLLVSASYFTALGVRPEVGRFFTPEEDVEAGGPAVVVLGHAFWRRTFGGDPQVIGRQLELGSRPYTIVGVAPAGFTGIDLGAIDVWLPMSAAGSTEPWQPWASARYVQWLRVIARLKPGVTPAQLGAQATPLNLLEGDERMVKVDATMEAVPLPAWLRRTRGANARVALLLGAVSTLVLLIACANVANLHLVRALARRREMAVRRALGVSRSRLAAQLFAESLALAALGGAVAVAIAAWGGTAARALLFGDVAWATPVVDARVLAYAAAVTLGAGLLVGLAPALQAGGVELTAALKAGAREGGGRPSRARATLLGTQAALAVILLVGTGLFVRSLRHVLHIDLGMQPQRVLLATMDLQATGRSAADKDALFRQMEARVRALPGVQSAALTVTVPGWGAYGYTMKVPGRDTLPQPSGGGPFLNAVRPGYFATMGTRILRGRDFTDADDLPNAARVAIINQTMARLWFPDVDPIGRCIKIGSAKEPCSEIVGVSQNSRQQSWVEGEILLVHIPLAQAGQLMSARLMVVRPAGDPASMIGTVRRAMQTTASGLPSAEVRPLMQLYADELRPWRLGAAMFGAFGALAVLLTAVGLYGVISFSVTQRRQEIGVRMALGARAGHVLRLVLRDAVTIALVGGAAGALAAAAAGPRVEGLLFNESSRDPAVFGAVMALLLAVSALSSLAPAWRATRVDPTVALRSE